MLLSLLAFPLRIQKQMKKESKQTDVLKLYAGLEDERKKVEEKLEALKPEILKVLEEKGVDTLQETYGTYSVVYRKRWTYSSELVQKEFEYNEIVKSRKQEEQTSGEAKAEVAKGLSYRAYVPKTNEKETI